LTRNEIARLRKVAVQLTIALDALHRANGELYPANLKTQRDTVAGLIGAAQRLQDEVVGLLPGPTIRNRPEAPAGPQPKDPLDLNLDDLPDAAA
jgi:hypothetical protein